jgi:hypothetical protein
MLTHLVKIPLLLRPAEPSDLAPLLHLQAASGCAPQAALGEARLATWLRGAPQLSFVADYNGDAVAALVAHPSQVPVEQMTAGSLLGFCAAQKQSCQRIARMTVDACAQGGPHAVELGWVHVAQNLEEQQELVECLLAFFLHFLLGHDHITCLLSGGGLPPPCPLFATS